MSEMDLLHIEPLELKFPFELRKQISCSLHLTNKTDNHVVFKVKTTNPKKYCVRPNTGLVLPKSTCDIIVTMQAQKEAPADMQCKDKFLLQSVVSGPGVTIKDISADMFNKEGGQHVEECKLRVSYVSPVQPPSPVPEGSEEGSSPRPSVSDNRRVNGSDFPAFSRSFIDPEVKSAEEKALITKLTEDRSKLVQHGEKLREELEFLRRESRKRTGGMPFLIVILIGFVGMILGYLMKKS